MNPSGDDAATITLQPGQSIKPNVSLSKAQQLVEDQYRVKVETIKELNSYDDNNFYVKATTKDGKQEKFILKVLNSMDSKKPGHIEAEHVVMIHLAKNGITCPIPQKNVQGQLYSLETIKNDVKDVDNNESTPSESSHIIRLLSFVEGKIMHDIRPTIKLFQKVGKYIAELENLLKGLSFTALDSHCSIWMISDFLDLEKFIFVIKNQPDRYSLVSSVLAAFKDRVLPLIPKLERGVFHGDFNEQNIIVKLSTTEPDEYDIHGLIDFGDMQVNPYVFELAITICYMMLECVKEGVNIDPFVGAQNVVKGYSSMRKLQDCEIEILRILVASRLCVSLVMGAYTYSLDPGNEYLLTTSKTGWTLLERVWKEKSDQEMITCWKEAIALH